MTFAVDYSDHEANKTLGLSIAVRDLTQAWLRYSAQERLIAHTADAVSQKSFIALAQGAGIDAATRCGLIDPCINPEALFSLSCLFAPDPDITRAAWRRAALGTPYACCGLVHAMSGERVSQTLANLCLAPLQKGDALICPSRAIRDVVTSLLALQTEYINHHFGGAYACPVQTPILPLGIDTEKFAALRTPEKRKEQRAAFGIQENEIVILFHGRLNFATKAHPLPLLLAATKAARKTRRPLRVVFHGYFLPREEMEGRFKSLIADFAGAVRCDIALNDDPRFPNGFWAGADIFASLVDNVQESFGLTPIEAMACGLPAVVTDWDGYRDGIREGQDGFLIPTALPPEAAGMAIAQRYFDARHYGGYLMGAAQSTAIDTDAAAAAFAALADDDALRLRMGESGQKRARAVYDWSVLIPSYEALWSNLAAQAKEEQAQRKPCPLPQNWQAAALAFPNPFHVFGGFPSQTLSPHDTLSLTMSEDDSALILRHDMNLFVPDLLLPPPLLHSLIDTLRARQGLSIENLLAVTPPLEHARLWRTVGWLLKHGLVAWTGKTRDT